MALIVNGVYGNCIHDRLRPFVRTFSQVQHYWRSAQAVIHHKGLQVFRQASKFRTQTRRLQHSKEKQLVQMLCSTELSRIVCKCSNTVPRPSYLQQQICQVRNVYQPLSIGHCAPALPTGYTKRVSQLVMKCSVNSPGIAAASIPILANSAITAWPC